MNHFLLGPLVYCTKFAKRDRLDRRPDAVISDVARFDAASLGDDFGDRQAAEPPLAWPHSAATERLRLIGAQATQFDISANLTSRHLLASADQDATGLRYPVLVPRPVKGVQKWPDMCVAPELALKRRRAPRDIRNDAEPFPDGQGSQPTLYCGCLGSHDCPAVSGDIDRRFPQPSPWVRDRLPAKLIRVPAMRRAD